MGTHNGNLIIGFVRKTEKDNSNYRNRITREMGEEKKFTEGKLKVFKQQTDLEILKLREVVGAKMQEINNKLEQVDDKLEKCEDTDIVIKQVEEMDAAL